jgi:hypothetical protein
MNVTLGSLLSEDLEALQELDLLPEDANVGDINDNGQRTLSGALGQGDNGTVQAPVQQEHQHVTRTQHIGRSGNLTWFEEMLDGSRLGRTQKTRRGAGFSNDGSTRVEWEVSEFFDDSTEEPQTTSGSKRKIGEVANDDDVNMQH